MDTFFLFYFFLIFSRIPFQFIFFASHLPNEDLAANFGVVSILILDFSFSF